MNRKLIAVLIGIVMVSAGVISLTTLFRADTIATQEVEHYFSGWAATQPSETSAQGVSSRWTYFNYEEMNVRTEEFSSWKPDTHIDNFASHDMDKHSFTIDPDQTPVAFSPNYEYKYVSQYSSDAQGRETQGFIIDPVEIPFYDPVAQKSRTYRFYKTHITTQLTLRVKGDYKIYQFGTIRGNEFPSVMQAEFNGNYKQSLSDYSDFDSAGSTMRLIVRLDIKNWKLGEYYHIDPNMWNGLGNAILWSKITEVNMDDVDQTAGWSYPLQFSGDFDQKDLSLYADIDDAFLKRDIIPSKEIEFIELGDTFHSSAYFTLDHSVWLGSNHDLTAEGFLKSWDVSDFYVKFKITSCIFSTWQESFASEGEVDITNPFEWEEVVVDSNWWNWLVINLGGGNVFLTILYLVLILAFIIMVIVTIINPTWIVNWFRKIGQAFTRRGT